MGQGKNEEREGKNRMSEMELTEGQLLSRDFGVGSPPTAVEVPPPPRTVETVTLEIRTLQHQAQGIILNYAIEIGRRLEEAKAMLPHGEWGAWLKRELDYSQSTAQNFMRVFREYGDSQQSLFGAAPKSQTFGNLTYSKALRLLAIPDEEERERFAIENDVEHMSTRELNEALKARDEAQEAAAAAQEEARRLNEQIADQARAYEVQLASVQADANNARSEADRVRMALETQRDKAQRLVDALSEANTAVQAAEDEHARLLRELEELRSRPAEADTEAVEAARKAAIAEMTAKLNTAKDAKKQADQKRKTVEEALEAAQRELAELKAKGPEVRELTQEEKDALTAQAVEQARAEDAQRLRGLEKQLAAADPNVAEFKVRFTSWQEEHRKMMEVLGRIAQTDEERAAKLQQAVKAALEQMTSP